MDKQQIFDKVWKGLEKQGFMKATEPGGANWISRRSGRLCAIGHLMGRHNIKRKILDKGLEDRAVAHIIEKVGVNFHEQRCFLWELLKNHDQSTSPDDMKTRMINSAKFHGLKYDDGEC